LTIRWSAEESDRVLALSPPEKRRQRASIHFRPDRARLRRVRRSEGICLLRTNLHAAAPEDLWKRHIVLTEIEQAFKAIRMIDVHLPTTDGRNLALPRYTQPEKGLELLIYRPNLAQPEQPPPRLEDLKARM